MATAYQGMQQYAQAKALLQEALRLHPYNPVVLELMAQVRAQNQENTFSCMSNEYL